MNNGVSDKVKKLVSEIDELTIEEKTKLVEEVLKTSDLQVVMGTAVWSSRFAPIQNYQLSIQNYDL